MNIAFQNFINTHKLFSPDQKVLLTVSGGKDSVCMEALFHQEKFIYGIAHCNFSLRNEESNADEDFVKSLAKNHNVPFYTKRFETAAFAKKNKISIQMAARILRYEWFEELRKENAFDYIATAHHKNDDIETYFINLLRGTGIAGLSGIQEKNNKIIRPLIFADKNQIEEFIAQNKIAYREDSSNSSDKYIRNKIRNKILPLLKEINPNVENAVSEDISILRDYHSISQKVIADLSSKIVTRKATHVEIKKINISKLQPQQTLFYEFLKEFNFSFSVTKEILYALDKESGKRFYSPTHRLILDREHLLITKIKTKEKKFFEISEELKSIELPINLYFQKKSVKEFQLEKSNNIAQFDLEKVEFPLILRRWKRGDYFYPLGMQTKKKLSDFFIDTKFSIVDKENCWLLCSSDSIIWLLGHRIDDRYKITSKTKNVLEITLFNKLS